MNMTVQFRNLKDLPELVGSTATPREAETAWEGCRRASQTTGVSWAVAKPAKRLSIDQQKNTSHCIAFAFNPPINFQSSILTGCVIGMVAAI